MKPTDEVTGNVVAWWKGWEKAYLIGKGFAITPGLMAASAKTYCPDPRTNMGTAMELLHHIIGVLDCAYYFDDNGWRVDIIDEADDVGSPILGCSYLLPISGTEFCEAVVNLAETVRQTQQKQPTTKES